MHFFPFIRVSSGTHAAVIGCADQFFGSQVDHKFIRLPDHLIGVTLRSYGNINHRRIGADRSGPCNRQYVLIPVFVSDTDHNRRKRIQHVAGFP